MSQAADEKRWTWDEYLDWEQRQPIKYELIDGFVHAMAGGTGDHDTICNNLRRELGTVLRGTNCRLQGPDLKVRAGANARYPDALIDCGPPARGSLFAQEPVAIFEVLSKSTAWIDQSLKLRDYDTTASVRYYVLISQDEPRALVYRRDEAGRLDSRTALLLEGLSASLELSTPRVTLPSASIYEGLEFDSAA